MGYSGAQFDPEKVDLFFESAAGKMQIIKDGVAVDYSEEEATKILSEPAVTAIADIKMGAAQATAWGCDLTYDYVKLTPITAHRQADMSQRETLQKLALLRSQQTQPESEFRTAISRFYRGEPN